MTMARAPRTKKHSQTTGRRNYRSIRSTRNFRDHLLALLEPYAEIWDGHLGTVNITQHWIELTPDPKPSTENLYRSALLQQKMEEETTQKTLEEGFINPPSPSVPRRSSSYRRRMGRCDFAFNTALLTPLRFETRTQSHELTSLSARSETPKFCRS